MNWMSEWIDGKERTDTYTRTQTHYTPGIHNLDNDDGDDNDDDDDNDDNDNDNARVLSGTPKLWFVMESKGE
ncbi:unnamed protein product [Onchocerca flexuosa]|uniref:Uncharacterized protein n=1 Tax=Onchocerca flexuosa TaxID=387005 RepID=A0A183HBV3_9BILA|nr:unnamed protein product [Onchocerca flexuosa]